MEYGRYFEEGMGYVEPDMLTYKKYLFQAAEQDNPLAFYELAVTMRFRDETEAVALFEKAVAGGLVRVKGSLAEMRKRGTGCDKNLPEALRLSAHGYPYLFWNIFTAVEEKYKAGDRTHEDVELERYFYLLGQGLYWYAYQSNQFEERSKKDKVFALRCLDYYCACVELQQKSIFTFLWCWNQSVGVKDVGVMIGKMVWENREDNLVQAFADSKEEQGVCVMF